jgi:hypothetical protein
VQNRHNSFENDRDGAGALANLSADFVGLPLELPPTIRPPCVRFAIITPVARVCFHHRPQLLKLFRSGVLVSPTAGALPSFTLFVTQFPPQRRIVLEVSKMALKSLLVTLKRFLVFSYTPGEFNDVSVGLELRER